MNIQVKIEGIDRLIDRLGRTSAEITDAVQAAGEESGKMLLSTEGLQRYPPATEANRPPAPYYERGRGMWVTEERNTGRSERLGTRWVVERVGDWSTRIGNGASYAPFVHGMEQAWFHAPRGWRKLWDVANEKLDEINRIYQAWIDRLIKRTFG